MSSCGGLDEQDDNAERQFWETPELVEKLLPYLDITSTKLLAESHKLTRQMLKKAFIWKKLIQRVLPRGEKANFWCDIFVLPLPFEKDPLLESERQKTHIVAETLTLVKGGSGHDNFHDDLIM